MKKNEEIACIYQQSLLSITSAHIFYFCFHPVKTHPRDIWYICILFSRSCQSTWCVFWSSFLLLHTMMLVSWLMLHFNVLVHCAKIGKWVFIKWCPTSCHPHAILWHGAMAAWARQQRENEWIDDIPTFLKHGWFKLRLLFIWLCTMLRFGVCNTISVLFDMN